MRLDDRSRLKKKKKRRKKKRQEKRGPEDTEYEFQYK